MQTHRFVLLAAVLAAAASASAQTAAPGRAVPERDATTHDANNQRIERIEVEDAGSRIDELREGGQTKSITVQPKAAVPAYQVQPADPTGTSAGSADSAPGSTGRRVWKLGEF